MFSSLRLLFVLLLYSGLSFAQVNGKSSDGPDRIRHTRSSETKSFYRVDVSGLPENVLGNFMNRLYASSSFTVTSVIKEDKTIDLASFRPAGHDAVYKEVASLLKAAQSDTASQKGKAQMQKFQTK